MHSIIENKEFFQRPVSVMEINSFQKKGLGPWLSKECSQYVPIFCTHELEASC